MTSKKVFIAGSTGLIGGYLLAKLIESNNIESIIAPTRKPNDHQNSKLINPKLDFGDINELEKSMKDVTDVFCCLGTTMKVAGSKEAFEKVDFTYCLNLAIAASNTSPKINFYVVTAMGSDANSSIYYNHIKGKLENELSKLPLKSLNIFRPSLLMGNRKEKRLGERIGILLAHIINPLLIGPLKNYRGIEASKVANFIYLKSLEENSGKSIWLSGDMQ
ncbi:MAG: hypothetical protein RLZZ175_1307 [Bacteroidota bacterium]|jgi:uncharacterized protein YbjT (DUF2867 family)